MKNKINVLSLFDGISCGRIALERAGIEVDNYYSSEIFSDSILVANDNYPQDKKNRLGDIENWKDWNIDFSKIDLVIGGSPCQGFSFCGKQLNFNDNRSRLFFFFVEILNHIKIENKDVLFLLENVRMKKEYSEVIDTLLGVKGYEINSSLLSAQMRKRLYWTNLEITKPIDKKITLQSILDDGYVEKNKSWCMLESWNRFPKKTESVIGRYKRSMMPIVFNTPECNFNEGWRALNRNECERLQTVPKGYTKAVKEQTAMGLLGNGWTVDVIAHILKEIKNE